MLIRAPSGIGWDNLQKFSVTWNGIISEDVVYARFSLLELRKMNNTFDENLGNDSVKSNTYIEV